MSASPVLHSTNLDAPRPAHTAALFTALTGLAFAGFLLLRPWGDKTGDPVTALAAFASPLWPVSHLLGAAVVILLLLRSVALRSAAGTPPRFGGVSPDVLLVALGAFGVVLYYGMEALALHGLALADGGTAAGQADAAALMAQVDFLRGEPFSMSVFGLGFLLLTLGVASAPGRARRPAGETGGWAGRLPSLSHWLLTAAVAAILPHFFLPPGGRILFGLVFLAVCLLNAETLRRTTWLR